MANPTQNGVLQKDDNGYPVMGGTSSLDDSTVINSAIDPITRRLLTNSSSGSGDVVGPSSSTDNAIVRFDGTTGKLIQNSTATLSDAGGIVATTVRADSGVGVGINPVNGNLTAYTSSENGNFGAILYNVNTSGSAARAAVTFNNNNYNGLIALNGSGFFQSGYNVPDAMTFQNTGPGGMDFALLNASGSIRFWTNLNNLRMIINDAGNIGVGTEFPGIYNSRFDVVVGASPANTTAVRTTDAVQGTTGTLLYTGLGAATGNTYGSIRALGSGGNAAANLVLQDGSGSVGIGTSTPGSTLQVNGGAAIGYSSTQAAPTNGLIVAGHLTVEGVTSTGATGTGKFVFDNTPTFVTPVLGVATATSINKVAITAPASSATLTIANGKTLTANNSITLSGTDSTTMTFPSTSATIARTDTAQTFTGIQTVSQILSTPATISVSSNAGTVTRSNRINNFTNSSAATMTITMSTTGATDGDMVMVVILDASGVAQTITWVNTEDSTVTAPTTSNGSTTLPLTVGFKWNAATSKWRCIAKA